MLVECKRCGAPLDVGQRVAMVSCAYCGASTRVRSMRTIAEETPSGWVPPPTWTPPSHVPMPTKPIPYLAPPKTMDYRQLVLGVVLLTLLVTVCPLLLLPLLMGGMFFQ